MKRCFFILLLIFPLLFFFSCSNLFNENPYFARVIGYEDPVPDDPLPITYTIVYDKNALNATGFTADSLHTYDEPKSLTANGFEYIGFNFAGWNTAEDGYGTPYYDQQVVLNLSEVRDDIIILFAQWSDKYTVVFNGNGANTEASPTMRFVDEGDTVDQPDVDPTRVGHTFEGWYTEIEGITAWDFELDTVMQNTTLYAKWQINIYTVSFESNEGSEVPATNAEHGSVIIAPENPTKTGFDFAGWYKEAELVNLWNFAADTVTEDITLYARWEIKTYTVRFEFNNETIPGFIEQDYAYGSLIPAGNIPSDPIRAIDITAGLYLDELPTHYTFDGWFADGTDTPFNFDTPIENDITLTARWNVPELIDTVPANNVALAVSYVNANAAAGEYILLLDADTTAASQTLSAANARLSLKTVNPATIALSGNGSLFNVGAGTVLALDDGIILLGRVSVDSDGIFVMGGSAYIDSNYDVLASTILISSPLTGPVPAAIITPLDYTIGTQILNPASVNLAESAARFNVTPLNDTPFFIDSQGRLANPTVGISLTFIQILEKAPPLSDITISKTGAGGNPVSYPIAVENPGQYNTIRWYLGDTLLSEAANIILNAADIPNGTYNFSVEVTIGLEIHGCTIILRVAP